MFNNKKSELWSNETTKSNTNQPFVNAGLKNASVTQSNNGAKKYKSHSNAFVTQFNSIGSYINPRSYDDIASDQSILWAQDPLMCVKFSIYVRMISRKTAMTNISGTEFITEDVQRGGEMKHEGIMRMLWLHMNHPTVFWDNILLFIYAGSWKDIFTMLQYDLVYHGWEDRKLNWDNFKDLILSGLEYENHVNLIKKYLPQIKAKSKCKTVEAQAKTIIGKWLANALYGSNTNKTYAEYRKMKSSGTAHEWQQLISQGKHNEVNFDSIHGKALKQLSRSKYFVNNDLYEKYGNWIESKSSTGVKYTGFVNELFYNLPYSLSDIDSNTQMTINKQFTSFVEKTKGEGEKNTKLIVVRDTSGSMNSRSINSMSAGDIAKSLALYFAEFLEGDFKDSWIEFNHDAKMHRWEGSNVLEKWYNDKSGYIGNTNFQSVIDLFLDIKQTGVEEKYFPTGILCISDGEFDPSELNKTNVESALQRLRSGGFSEEYVNNFVICLWDIPHYNSGSKFETFNDVDNVFYMSGYSASIVQFLMEDIKNASELFDVAMDQELLNHVEV